MIVGSNMKETCLCDIKIKYTSFLTTKTLDNYFWFLLINVMMPLTNPKE